MKIKKFVKDWLCSASVYYTSLSTVIILIALILRSDNENSIQAVNMLEPEMFLNLLLFSLFMGAGYSAYRTEKLSPVPKRVIHSVCYIGSFALFLSLGNADLSLILVGTLVFAFLYVIVALIFALAKKKAPYKEQFGSSERSADKKSKSSYTSQFGR